MSAFVVLASLALAEPPPAKVVLGGPRKVEATVDRQGDGWSVKVRMVAVKSFDAVTNSRLNREKARSYALQALTRFLVGKDTGELAVSGVEVVKTGTDGQFDTLELTVPCDRVTIVEKEQHPPKTTERIAFTSTLFTRKSDLERTITFVSDFLLADLERLAHAKGESFDNGIADLEERVDAAFAVITKEIDGEKLLLKLEANELREVAAKQKARVFDALRGAVARHDKPSKPAEPPPAVTKAFRDIVVDPPFDSVLFANVLLMETTGAKVVRLPDGGRMILAVGSTVLKVDTPKERLRAEVVCRTKALASLVAEKEGVQVVRVETLKETTVVTIDSGKETAKSVSDFLQTTTAKVEGIAKDMPVVGRWKSKDGTVAYLAVGVVLGAEK